MRFLTLSDFDYRGRRVLVREDLNVPMKDPSTSLGTSSVADDTRLVAALPTLRKLHEGGARTIICSHLGRPDGKPDPKYSLEPVGKRLSELLKLPITFVSDCIGPEAKAAAMKLRDGEFLLLENVRFHPEEEKNDKHFAEELAALAERYVNDAFGTAHRAHASTEGVAHFLPCAAGLLMEAELSALSKLTEDPKQPYVCAIGGAKIADKIGVFTNLIGKVNAFCVGGGMGNTFLAASGVDVGKSLRDPDLEPAKKILALARERGVEFHLPTDAIVANSLDDGTLSAEVLLLEPLGDRMILDIGPRDLRRVRGGDSPGKYGRFQRTDGRVRKGAVPAGYTRHRPRPRRSDGHGCDDGRRRRRRCRSRTHAWIRQRRYPREHRRRRNARISRRQNLARSRRTRSMQRRTLIVGNWKMHKTIVQARQLVRALLDDKSWQHTNIDVVIAPPFTALAAVSIELGSATKPRLGAQTMHWGEQGAYTGEISPLMLLEVGCKFVILGHSERRADEGETDLRVNMKVKSALKHGITPIIAVGESVSEHEQGRAKERVCSQILAALDGIDAEGRQRCVLAYEPIWAIGSGLAEDPRTADDVMGAIRFCDPTLANARILYGGSMKPGNVAGFIAQPNIDGGLIGGASLDAMIFSELIRNAHSAVAA